MGAKTFLFFVIRERRMEKGPLQRAKAYRCLRSTDYAVNVNVSVPL